jgi:hypothetical protein
VTEPVSSAGDEMLDAVFGRDIAFILFILAERRIDASQEAMG